MSGVGDREQGGPACQTASSDANENLGKQLDLDFFEKLLGDESIEINGGYEETQAKFLQDCATVQTHRHEPATATSKSGSKTLPTHTDDLMRDHELEAQQIPAGATNENAGDENGVSPPVAEGVEPAQSDGMGIFEFSTSIANSVDTPLSDTGKYVDVNHIATDEQCEAQYDALPDAAPAGTAADAAVHASAAEPFHAEHSALHGLDVQMQTEGGEEDLAAAEPENSHPLVVNPNDLGWADWRLNDSLPLGDVEDPLSKFAPWGEASSSDTASDGGKEEGEGQPEVEGQQEDGREKEAGEAGDGEGARQGKNNTKPIVQVRAFVCLFQYLCACQVTCYCFHARDLVILYVMLYA
jgi:hypothetical protein